MLVVLLFSQGNGSHGDQSKGAAFDLNVPTCVFRGDLLAAEVRHLAKPLFLRGLGDLQAESGKGLQKQCASFSRDAPRISKLVDSLCVEFEIDIRTHKFE